MNQLFFLQTTSYLFSFAIFLQSLEMLIISKQEIFLKVWSFKNLQKSLPIKAFFKAIFSERGFKALIYLNLTLVVGSFFRPAAPLLIFSIAFIHLLICIRFRGLFNGGSDMMVFVIATGIIIGPKFGLFYIMLHTCFSYFKAGIAKVIQPSWRSGIAINQFLGISLYSDVQKMRLPKYVSRFLSYCVLLFELLLPIIFIEPKLAYAYCAISIIFHIVNYFAFGLNRFIWIWLAAWPAVIYGTQSITF